MKRIQGYMRRGLDALMIHIDMSQCYGRGEILCELMKLRLNWLGSTNEMTLHQWSAVEGASGCGQPIIEFIRVSYRITPGRLSTSCRPAGAGDAANGKYDRITEETTPAFFRGIISSWSNALIASRFGQKRLLNERDVMFPSAALVHGYGSSGSRFDHFIFSTNTVDV